MTSKYSNITLVLLPNQLFHPDVLKDIISEHTDDLHKLKVNIIMLEHPVYFGMRNPYGQMRFNKLKLLYQMSTTRYYIEETLGNNKHLPFTLGNVTYITNKAKWNPLLAKQNNVKNCEALL
jgi:hypothetical protein